MTICSRASVIVVELGLGPSRRRPGSAHRTTVSGLAGVLVAIAVVGCSGGFIAPPIAHATSKPTSIAPRTSPGEFSPTGSTTTRYYQTATLLSNGLVLIAGGCCNGTASLASAELYDPKTGTFSPTGSMTTGRIDQAATLPADGRVLIVGGAGDASAELYNPTTGAFSPTGSTTTVRAGPTATLLADGRSSSRRSRRRFG